MRYEKPILEVITFNTNDIVCESGGDMDVVVGDGQGDEF